MAEWYSKTIRSSDFVTNPAKKHYIRTGISYSFTGHLYRESSASTTKKLNYYFYEEETVRRTSFEGNQTAHCSGSAPYNKTTFLYATVSGYIDTYDVPIFFETPSYAPAGNYVVITGLTVSTVYGSKKVPTATASFTGGFIDFTKANSINFGTKSSSDIDEQYTVSSGTFYFRETGAGSYTAIAFTGDTLTIPANTFASGKTYEAYADLVLDDGTAATYTFAEITTIDTVGTCSGIDPKNEVVYGDVVFSWSYSNSTGTAQKAYDLQISPDGETWTDVFSHVLSSETSATYTQTLSGNTYWRVRGYNQNDVAGSWSTPLYYINNVPPEPPVIGSVTGNGRQTVAWSADAQVAYHVRVIDQSGNVVYDTGEVYSTNGSALINEYLIDGTYAFQVRIATAIGGWSEWSSVQKTVTATMADPEFTLIVSDSGVTVTIDSIETAVKYLIYRNGELIGETVSFLNDFFVSGDAEYRVVIVDTATDSYGYSSQSISFTPAHNQIVTEDGEIFLVNRRLNERAFPQRSISPKYEAYEFLGEDRPTHVFADNFRSGSFTVAIYDKEGRADDLLGKRIFFSTTSGWGDWCVVTSINRREVLFGNDVTISMELTSKPEITL